MQSGQLTGLAQDQNTIVVERDLEARQSSATTSNDNQSRHLRDIVRDSTERWQLPTADADREYYEELRAMGYQVEDAEEKLQERGKEYHGMLKMGCRRYPRCTPLLISLSRKIPIAKVASGYAHAMLLARSGQLYAAGYNDRGQLGLG